MEVIPATILSADTVLLELDAMLGTQELSLMDAIIYYCERNNIEIETVAKIVKANAKFKSLLQEEAENLNFLPKQVRLSFE